MIKQTGTIKRVEYLDKCPICKKQIKGTSEGQVKYNIKTHIRQKHPKKNGKRRI